MILNILYSKLCIGFASRVAKRLRILGNYKMKRKSQSWVKPQGSVQSTPQKFISGNSDQNLRKGRLQRLLFLSNSAWFPNIGQSILLVIRKLQWT